MKIAIDTNILIYAIEGGQLHQAATQILQLTQTRLDGFISSLALTELLSNSHLSDEQAQDFYQTFNQLSVTKVDISEEVILHTAQLRRHHHITTPDAIHLASATSVKARYFITADDTLLKLNVAGLKIIKPTSFLRQHHLSN